MANFELEQYLGSIGQLPKASVQILVDAFEPKLCKPSDVLARQSEANSAEYILLSGKVVCTIMDRSGRETAIGFYEGSSVLPPSISRSRADKSLLTINVTSAAVVAEMQSDHLMELMVQNEPIRNWANDVMRIELQRSAEHQWALAALNNKEKLSWFRDTYERYEEKFEHWRIASYLGMTPVSFSRARSQLGAKN